MKERGYDQKFILLKLVTVFVIAIIVIIFATLYFHASPRFEKQIPAAEKGRMDLSAWDFNKNGVVELKGEWECYDGQLLLPEDFSGGVQQKPRLTGYAKLTADEMESPGAYLPDPMGVRTFRLVVKTSPAA